MSKTPKKQVTCRLNESSIEFLQKQAGILEISTTEVLQNIIDAYENQLYLDNQTTLYGYYSFALEKQLLNLYPRGQIDVYASSKEILVSVEYRVCFRYVKSKKDRIKPQEFEKFEERVWQIAESISKSSEKVQYVDLTRARELDRGYLSESLVQDSPLDDLESRLKDMKA
jgi:hypothetical protein